jgi:hypothetical protein
MKTKQYQELVDKAKDLYHVINSNKLEIAKLAIKVCTIRHGGKSDGYYTLKEFSIDCQIPYKRLSEWVITYKTIVVKIPNLVKTNEDWSRACKLAESLAKQRAILNKTNKTIGSKVLFKEELDKPSEEIARMFIEKNDNTQRLEYAVQASSRCLFNLNALSRLKDEDLKYIYEISEDLEKILVTIKRCQEIIDFRMNEVKK